MEWQDIETAPKDGTRVKLLIPYTGFTEAQCTDEGEWEPLLPRTAERVPDWAYEQGGCWRFDGDDGRFDIQPTHWMPRK